MRPEIVLTLAIVVGASGYLLGRTTTDAPLIQDATPAEPIAFHTPRTDQVLPGKRVQGLPTPARGSSDASVVIVEFSDFQCPFSQRLRLALDRVVHEFPTDVRHEFRHFPLAFHREAKGAAIASLAAHRQGRFWEMRDRFLENPRKLSQGNFLKWAEELKMDLGRFESDLKNPALAQQVENDIRAGKVLLVRGTPTFIINGKRINVSNYLQLKSVVDTELQRSKGRISNGMTAGQAFLTGVIRNAPNADTYFKELLGTQSLILEMGPPTLEWHP